MQANLFKLLAIAAAFSAVHSAPVETAEVTKAQVNGTQVNGLQINGTQINDSFRVAGVEKTCYKRDLPHISERGKEGDIFERSCRGQTCWHHDQCIAWGCRECNLHFDACGNSWTACW